MPEDLPHRMPEDMPDKMPEDMSDRMPEDLPVTKRINVMVGISRSKVILNSFLERFWMIHCCLTSFDIQGVEESHLYELNAIFDVSEADFCWSWESWGGQDGQLMSTPD